MTGADLYGVILMAVLCAAVTVWLVTPLMRNRSRAPALVLLVLIPGGALALYMPLGTPGQPGAYAGLADAQSPRARKRAVLDRVMQLEQRIAQADEVAVVDLVTLAGLRHKLGRHEGALAALKRAKQRRPDDPDIASKLGAARFVAGLAAFRRGKRDKAANHWGKARKAAPPDAPYREAIDKAIRRVRQER